MKAQVDVSTTKRLDGPIGKNGFRFGFAAMILSLMVLLAGSAHAEPNAANQYLQIAKSRFYVTKINFQIGSNFALAGNAAAARPYYISANIGATQTYADATALYSQNIDTLNRGLYRNAYYQQQAVQYSNILRSYVRVLNVNLSILSQVPLSASSRISAEIGIAQINATLLNLEQAMILAQR